jgi:DNA repair exonuclease SbcCD ATPase subunit
MTDPKERLRYSGEMYIEQWCDGNGNLGPCSCGDGPQGKGHWRLSRTVKLDDVLEAARKQWDEETPAQWQDCTECAEKAKRAEKERDEARAEVERFRNAVREKERLELEALQELDEARADAKKHEELMWHYKAAFEYLKSPAKACLDERAEGNGGCGACSVCCGELRDKLAAVTRERDEARAEVEREKASATRGWQTADELHLTVRDLKSEMARLRSERDKMEAAMTHAIIERNAILDQARARSKSVAERQREACAAQFDTGPERKRMWASLVRKTPLVTEEKSDA